MARDYGGPELETEHELERERAREGAQGEAVGRRGAARRGREEEALAAGERRRVALERAMYDGNQEHAAVQTRGTERERER
jgi:hypothetical protein